VPIIDGFLLTAAKGTWSATFKQYGITSLGAWGKISKAEKVQIGPNKYGSYFYNTDGGQGTVFGRGTIIVDNNNGFAIAFDASLNGDNSAVCKAENNDCWRFTTNMKFVQGKSSDYYNLVVERSGTKLGPDFKTIISAEETKTFIYSNSQYAEVLN